MESNKSAALASSLTGIICDVRIRRSAGEHRTRLTSANRQRRRHWPPDAMARRCREFVDSRLRRSPPDRASAVPYGQAGENAMRFPRLAHRSAAAHKLHSTPQQHRMNLISGNDQTSSRLPAFSLLLPESCPNNRDRGRVQLQVSQLLMNNRSHNRAIDDVEADEMKPSCWAVAAAVLLIGMSANDVSLAQKTGGILRMYD